MSLKNPDGIFEIQAERVEMVRTNSREGMVEVDGLGRLKMMSQVCQVQPPATKGGSDLFPKTLDPTLSFSRKPSTFLFVCSWQKDGG
jgi:hypothetical protein